MNTLTNKLIIVAGVILVLLIVVTVFISSLTKKTQSGKQPTLVPTGFFESTGEQMKPTLSESELKQEVAEINSRLLSTDQVEKLDEIKTKLPISTNDFGLGYSYITGQFYVQKKSSQADTALQKFFQNNNFLDVYQKYPELFVNTTNQPVGQAIRQAEQNVTSIQQEQEPQSNQPKPTERKKTQLEKQQALFFDFIGIFTDFELGTTSSSGSNKSGGGNNLQNINISGRTVGKTTVPTAGTLTPIQIAAAAVIARYGNAPTAKSINWTWVTEATAVGLAESGGYCCSGRTDTNSWGLWQIDAGNAHMNVSNTDLYDPLLNAQAMWSIQGREVGMSQSRYGTNWGAYWSTGRPGANRFFKNAEFYNPAQQAAAQLKSQL